jgi:hypothetical protein
MDDYIFVILGRERIGDFLDRHMKPSEGEGAREAARRLLEMEELAQLMYTSCGWYFEDISRIESEQVIAYALRAAQIAKEVSNVDLLSGYCTMVYSCKPNDPRYPTGKSVVDEVMSKSGSVLL